MTPETVAPDAARRNGRPAGGRFQRAAGERPSLRCSVGIMAYNEEANIADAISSVLDQELAASRLTELIVVASGCEDRTTAIVDDIARRDRRVRLIEQRRREGKASAINLFIRAARSEILLLVGADVLVRDGSVESILRHFEDPATGMVGGRPIPVNHETSFLGHAVHLQWRLHDRIARQSPKLGEVVAFRNVVPNVPVDTAVDEMSIQAAVSKLGYRLVYEPEAVVYNRGPATVHDFLRQRRRIHAGHLRVRDRDDYPAPTMRAGRVLAALPRSGSLGTPRAVAWSIGTAGLEAVARGLGRYDVLRRRPQHVWAVSATTKRHVAEGTNGQSEQNVLVFQIANFHQQQLELGVHATRRLTRRMTDHVKRALGADGIVAIERSGTVIALLPGDREAAERSARELARRIEAAGLARNGQGHASPVVLACGVMAVPQAGPPVPEALPQ